LLFVSACCASAAPPLSQKGEVARSAGGVSYSADFFGEFCPPQKCGGT